MTSSIQEILLTNNPLDPNISTTRDEGLVIFCRHGQLDLFGGNADLSKYRGVYASGDSDIELSDEGFEQARKFGFYLYYRAKEFNKIPIFTYSPAMRCWQTYKTSLMMSVLYDKYYELGIDELREHILDFIITGQTGARLKSSTDFMLNMDRLVAAIPNYYEYTSEGMKLIHESTGSFQRRSRLGFCKSIFGAINTIRQTKSVETANDLQGHDLIIHTHGRMINEWCGPMLKNWGYNYVPRCLPLAIPWSHAIGLAKIYAKEFEGIECLVGLDTNIGFDEPEIKNQQLITPALHELRREVVLKKYFQGINLPFWLSN